MTRSFSPKTMGILSPGEEKVYLACLQNGPISMSDCATQTGIKRPTLYPIIQSLAEQGIITVSKRGKRPVYDAAPPSLLVKKAEERAEHVRTMLPNLEALRLGEHILPEVTVLSTEESLRSFYSEIYRTIEQGEEVCFLTSIGDLERHAPWIMEGYLQTVAKQPHPKIRELIRSDNAGKTYTRHLRIAGHTHPCRLLPKEMGVRNDLVITEHTVTFVTVAKRPLAVSLRAADLCTTVRALYECAWSMGKPR